MSFRSGDVLFREGDPSSAVYRLLSGEATVARETHAGSALIGATRPGDFVGEMGVLIGAVRNATVTFTRDAVLEQFTRKQFLELLADDYALGMRVLHALSLRTRVLVDRLHELGQCELRSPGISGRLKHTLTWSAKAPIDFLRRKAKFVPRSFRRDGKAVDHLQGCPELHLKKGEVLLVDGEVSRNVYWLESGAIEVSKGGRRIGKLRPGEFIGEMGVLESRPRSATATASKASVLRELGPDKFFQLMRESKPAYFEVIDSLCERSRRLTQQIRELQPTQGDGIYEAIGSVESLSQLAEQRLVNDVQLIGRFFTVQVDHGKEMIIAYQRYIRGQATKEELERANRHLCDYFKMAGVGTLILLPGSVLAIPVAAKLGTILGINIFPNVD